MIAIGGVIGAGLFVGSGAVINQQGPVAVVSYIGAGVLVVLVMRMLGEMAAANPTVGSFAEYARRALGDRWGFAVGWLYWYFWVIVIAVEAVAGAAILKHWIPGIPLWAGSLGLIVLLTLTNVVSVRSYGEFEFWFASIKVAAIVVFLALGTAYVVGLWPNQDMSFANLYANGGFAPNGWGGAIKGINVIIFSFVGAEIATIAAAESADPARSVARATSTVVWRILIFYVGSIFLITVILPWNSARVLESPFVSALRVMGVGDVSEVMNAIVLTAVLSCLNSGLYTASRMLFALAHRGDAPRGLLDVTARGVPLKAILLSTAFGYIGVVMAYASPETVFLFLLNSSGAIALFVYTLIAISELRMRRQIERDAPERLIVKMWLYPYLSIVAVAMTIIVTISMALTRNTRSQFVMSVISVLVVFALYEAMRRIRAAREAPRPVPVAPSAEPYPDVQAERVLVVANETVGADELLRELRRIAGEKHARYFVMVPALPLHSGQGAVWAEEGIIAAAQHRLLQTLEYLRNEGLHAEGQIGDHRPLHAIKDAVEAFHPDLVVISTHPEGRSVWLANNIVRETERRFGIPVRHVVSHVPASVLEPEL
jgi:GABA permease